MLVKYPHTSAGSKIAAIERLPKWLVCVPLVAQWLWLGLRYRSFTLPTVVNPQIETGGIAGESKIACLDLIDAAFDRWVARPVIVRPQDDVRNVHARTGFDFPVIAKPDIGWCGHGVRRIDTPAALDAYSRSFPPKSRFLLQRLIDQAHEAGLLYLRWPDQAAGRITGLTLRHRPQVYGDGRSSTGQLIGANPRTKRFAKHYRRILGPSEMARVPQSGERVFLTTIASIRVGARYEAAKDLVSPALEHRLDLIARSMGAFHFGRFDVKFISIDALQQGEFTIVEVNGAGSEAIQFWDPSLSLKAALAGVFEKQRTLFKLADILRRRGHEPASLQTLGAAYLRQQRLISRYPAST